MKSLLLTTLLLLALTSPGVSQDTTNIQSIINNAKLMQSEINDINLRMESYASLNNAAGVLMLLSVGAGVWYAASDQNEDALLYVSAGLGAVATTMLFINPNRLKRKSYKLQPTPSGGAITNQNK